jgi:hypothetical protein
VSLFALVIAKDGPGNPSQWLDPKQVSRLVLSAFANDPKSRSSNLYLAGPKKFLFFLYRIVGLNPADHLAPLSKQRADTLETTKTLFKIDQRPTKQCVFIHLTHFIACLFWQSRRTSEQLSMQKDDALQAF